jgi:hypothetical protein
MELLVAAVWVAFIAALVVAGNRGRELILLGMWIALAIPVAVSLGRLLLT